MKSAQEKNFVSSLKIKLVIKGGKMIKRDDNGDIKITRNGILFLNFLIALVIALFSIGTYIIGRNISVAQAQTNLEMRVATLERKMEKMESCFDEINKTLIAIREDLAVIKFKLGIKDGKNPDN